MDTDSCTYRSDFLSGRQREEKRYGSYTRRLCNTYVRNGIDVVFGCGTAECAAVQRHVCGIPESHTRNHHRSRCYGYNPVEFRFCRNTSGACIDGSRYIQRCHSDNNGTEYRNVCYGHDFLYRNKQECTSCRTCSFEF